MHYQRFRDHDYLGAWDFEDGDKTVTIEKVEQGFVDRHPEAPERVALVHIRELDRPMILNSTNGALIAAMYGTPDTREWVGKRIILMRGMTTDKSGHPCFGIRVKPERPRDEAVVAESEAERIARLEGELAKARAAIRGEPALPAPPAAPATVPKENFFGGAANVNRAADASG